MSIAGHFPQRVEVMRMHHVMHTKLVDGANALSPVGMSAQGCGMDDGLGEVVGGGELDRLRQDREALNRLVARREDFYRGVLESLGEGVLITNADSVIVYANRRMEELTGWSPAELVGRVSYEVLSPPELHGLMRERLQERLGGRGEEYENELVRRDGVRSWIQVRAVPYRDDAGRILGTIGTLSCIQRRKELERENDRLREVLGEQRRTIVGTSPALMKVLEQVRLVGPTDASVLLLGESGTGKELVAQAVHEAGARATGPLVRVNCASVPRELFESEFFGHARGAFTGAVRDRPGRFELADRGTLFLDEVGEIPLELQAKLLRVLQEGTLERVGEERTRRVDVRVVAATNRDLRACVRAGRFREDLYYRLSVFPIELPPLRERREDIPLLAAHFLRESATRIGVRGLRLGRSQLAQLQAHDWPGNVRELQNVIERAVIGAREGGVVIPLPDRGPSGRAAVMERASGPEPGDAVAPGVLDDLRRRERDLMRSALKASGGRIHGPDGAAARLGMRSTTFASRVRRWGLRSDG